VLPLRGLSDEELSLDAGFRGIIVRPPLRLRPGDCLGWTVCGEVPFPFDDGPDVAGDGAGAGPTMVATAGVCAGTAVMGWSEEMPELPTEGTNRYTSLPVQPAPCRVYSVYATLYSEPAPSRGAGPSAGAPVGSSKGYGPDVWYAQRGA